MTYQVLARKWRPQNFKDMVGQDHISSTLCNAILNQRVGHAYLFVGTRGTGKTTTARIFAKAINCENPLPDANPCDVCTNCKEITAGSCMDVLEIDGASNNGVDDIRRLRENVQYTPARCSYKVYIIDEVHMLSTAAWNALLKTLEEPPEHVKFLFATTEAHKVLPTILSRCQRFDLKRISQGTISRRLQEVASQENANFDQSSLNAIARAANGGMRDALSIMDQMIAFCSDLEVITEHDVSEVFGLTSNNDLAQITIAMLNNNAADLIREINHLADVGRNLEQLYSDLLQFNRNLMICSISGEQAKSILDLDAHELSIAKSITEQANSETLQRLVDGYLSHDGKLRNTLNKRVFLEMTLIRIMKDAHTVSLNDILKRLNHLRKTGSFDALESPTPTAISVELPEVEKKKITPTKPESIPARVTTDNIATETPKEIEVEQAQQEPEIQSPTTEALDQEEKPEAPLQEPPHTIPSPEVEDDRPDYLKSIPQNLATEDTPVEENTSTPIVEESHEAAATFQDNELAKNPEDDSTGTLNESDTDEKGIENLIVTTTDKIPRTQKNISRTIYNLDSTNNLKKVAINDGIELPYSTLIDSDYIEKARKQDPLQLGLQKYQSNFDENEETPGSVLGAFYYQDLNAPETTAQNIAPVQETESIATAQETEAQQEPENIVTTQETEVQQESESIATTQETEVQQEQTIEVTTDEVIIDQPIIPIAAQIQTAEVIEELSTPPEQLNETEATTGTTEEIKVEEESPFIGEESEPQVTEVTPKEKVDYGKIAQDTWAACEASFNSLPPEQKNIIETLSPISLTTDTFIITSNGQSEDLPPEVLASIKRAICQNLNSQNLDIKVVSAVENTEEDLKRLGSGEDVWSRVKANPVFSKVCEEFNGTIVDVRG